MLIINPAFGLDHGGGEQRAREAIDWQQDPIALFSNAKPNARELLEGVRERLGSFRRIDNIDYVAKESVSQPAPPALLEHVAQNYRAALMAIAD
ncbi:MAG: hypothetical protein ACI9DC_002321 [Gammaproteobacteria bacterium]|jgi:hypothetical protein